MKYTADLHIHSFYSRATSKDLTFEHLWKWAQLKGLQVVATGDIAHPGWLEEIKEKLEPAEEGLFKLKSEYEIKVKEEIPKACKSTVRFLIGGEISNIYKKNDKVRKIHNVVFTPSIEATEKLQARLEKIGNIRSDGRPILGLDSRDLLEIVLEVDPNAYLIPAHIWTPWFAMLGSKSGFDSVEECFGDLTGHIFALETGLSSDPPMNWRLSQLDRYTLVSNSDAHSPQKLAREANIFNTDLSYHSLFDALKTGNQEKFWGTIEFFPEEGKYHFDGHRKCGISWDPKTTLKHGEKCPVCGKPVTVGVMHRIESLADREEGARKDNAHHYKSLIPLPEVLSEVLQVGVSSKKVNQAYESLLENLGSELSILLNIPIEDIKPAGGELLAEGIKRMREGNVTLNPGYDGEYGVIKLFEDDERDKFSMQLGFFGDGEKKQIKVKTKIMKELNKESDLFQNDTLNKSKVDTDKIIVGEKEEIYNEKENSVLKGLNPQQKEAVLCTDVPLIISAGPGTGKTKTLTNRIAYLIKEGTASPDNILAITFTNKAAGEMGSRLTKLINKDSAKRITIKTFHAFGVMILRNEGERIGLKKTFSICSEDERKIVLKELYPDFSEKEINNYLEQIPNAKNNLLTYNTTEVKEFAEVYKNYQSYLKQNQSVDFDDLIASTVNLFEENEDILKKYQAMYKWISVDEYQDINFAQYKLLKLLYAPENNICVIGDPDQAIYGFRGSDRKYFLKFREDFPNAKAVYLNKNYRSTQTILDASGQVISKSIEKKDAKLISDIISKTRLEIYQAPTYKAEAEYIVHQIEKMVGGTSYFSIDSGRVDDDDIGSRSFSDFAVLYRLSAQVHPLVEAFERSGIPYQTTGETQFYEMKEVKEILNYLRFIYNPDSKIQVRKDDKFLQKILPLLEEIRLNYESYTITQMIERINEFLTKNFSGKDNSKRNDLIKRLISRATSFDKRLNDFLESAVLQKETDEYDPRADRVTLMTLHASKGLEFPVVFITGCEENLIPYVKTASFQKVPPLEKQTDIDEERRLFYVGMTRAQEKLILTHCKSRFLFGKTMENRPSRFINDIENKLKELKKAELRKPKGEKKEEDTGQLGLF